MREMADTLPILIPIAASLAGLVLIPLASPEPALSPSLTLRVNSAEGLWVIVLAILG